MILALWYHGILATLFSFAAIALIGVILLQRGKGVGLSGAFGGAGGHTAFGAKTGDVLTWITIIGAVVVLAGAVILNYIFVPVTPFPVAPVIGPAPGATAPPTETAPPIDTSTPAQDAETTPADTTPAGEPETPAGGGEAPGFARSPHDRIDRPTYASHMIFGENLG